MFKLKIIKALQDRYEAQISECEAVIDVYLTNPVGIGEHPQIVDEVDKLVSKMAGAEEKIKMLQKFKL